MRSPVLLGLTAAIFVASAAFAQETPAPAPEPMPAAEPAQPPAPPAAPEAPQPPAAPEAPPAPPPPPPAPTDPTSLAVLATLERVCAPMVRGQGDLKSLATPLGFKFKKQVWTWTYQKGYTISITPPGTNPEVCRVNVRHPVGGVIPVIVDIHNWAMARGWDLYRNDKFVTDLERTTRSWELREENSVEAVVLVSSRKADGSPLTSRYDETELLYSLYKQ